MPGNGKDSGRKGAEADFFGEGDNAWLDDDPRNSLAPTPAAALAPAAAHAPPKSQPPPPPPSLRTTTPATGTASDGPWAARTSTPPPKPGAANLSSQPTLVWSDVPTLPPADPPPAGRAPLAAEETPISADSEPRRHPPVGYDEPPISDPEPSLAEAETVEVTSVGLPADRPTEPTEAVATSGAGALVWPSGVEALGPSSTVEADPVSVVEAGIPAAPPAPEPPAPAPPAPPAAAPPAPRAPVAPPRPVDVREPPRGVDGWVALDALLAAEAEGWGPTERALFAAERGHLALRVLGNPADADARYEEAGALGARSPELLRRQAEARAASQRWADQETTLLELAAATDDVDRTEALLEAGLVAWRRRERPDQAVETFARASASRADDYTSRALQRALLPGLGKEQLPRRVELLAEIAGLAEGGIRADALVERSSVAEELGWTPTVLESLRGALAAEPGHTFAWQRLERALAHDPSALAELCAAEAVRAGQPDPGYWRWRESLAYRDAGRSDLAAAALEQARAAGWPCRREREALHLLGSGPTSEGVEAVLAEEAASGPSAARAAAAFRLGWLRERRGDAAGALAAYQACVEADPDAGPAADAVARVGRRSGADRLEVWRERLAAASGAGAVPVALRVAEAALAARRPGEARAALERAAGAEGADRELVADLLDVALALDGDADATRAHRRRRADAATDPGERVSWLLLAATTLAEDPGVPGLLRQALDARPDHPVALAAATVAAHRSGATDDLAVRLRRAAEFAADPERKAALYHRAARLAADAGDDAGAAPLAADAARLAPGSTHLAALDRALAGSDPAALSGHYREVAARLDGAGAGGEPGRRAWAAFAAAVTSPDRDAARRDLDALLREHPDHAGAAHLLEVVLLVAGEHEALLDLYQAGDGEDPAELLRNAVLLTEAGRTEEAILGLRRLRTAPPGTPIRPAARAAVELGMADLGAEILAASTSAEDRTERARLLAGLGRPAEALPLLRALAADGPDPVGVSARLATVAQQAGDHGAMIDAYATLAHEARSPSLRAAYGAWTAMQLQAAGRDADTLDAWRVALAERPGSTTALLGAARALVVRRDVDGLRRLFAMLRPEVGALLAEHVWLAGDAAAAADLLIRDAGDDPARRVVALLRAERWREELAFALDGTAEATAEWQAVYDLVTRRREFCRTAAGRDDADARRRWILRERLAATEAAWSLYRQLHDESPGDASVTEALARIAAARGDVPLAIRYLTELAQTAVAPADAARYRRRIGETWEAAGAPEAARQAFLDALDHVPGDPEAESALRRLAEAAGDWAAVIGILQRQAGAAPNRAAQVDLRRQIARLTEDRLGDPRVAMDAWRAVLELVPDEPEALDHLIALAAGRRQWSVYVEVGQARVRSLAGPHRTALLARLGAVCLDELDREDGVRFLEQAVASDPPDLDAARRLEQLARRRGDWAAVARLLLVQARASGDRAERVRSLQAAARLQNESLHQPAEAAATWTQVLTLEPDDETALRFLATWLYEQDRTAEAVRVCARLEPILERQPDPEDFDDRVERATFFFSYAELLRKAGQDEEAAARYARTLRLNPAHLASLEAVGPLYVAAEQWAEAENVYRQLVQLVGGAGDKARTAAVYTQLGIVERQRGKHESAHKRFSKALELAPNYVGALKGMALVLEDRADWSNLLNVYNNIIYHATQPEDVIDAYMTKGRILDDQMQRQDKAAQHYQRSLDFDPAQPHALLRLAELAMRRDAYKEAGELADRAFALDQDLVDPWRARLLLVRAAALQDGQRAAEAERCVREARVLDAALGARLPEAPLGDLEGLRRALKDSLPARG